MALTPSTMLELGVRAPYFDLPDFEGRRVSLSEDDVGEAPATLVIFMCNHCPYVINLKEHLSEAAKQWQERGAKVFAINSNDSSRYAQDGAERMKEDAVRFNYTFPYLIDESQHVAKSYKAACTPDFFLFNRDLKLVYRGQYDDSRPGNEISVTGHDLGDAVDALFTGKKISDKQKPSMGCNIKWKPGNEPRYP